MRLVKGAYWDTETILARQHQWPVPVWQEKHCSDANYELLSRVLLENCKLVLPAFASHNIRSLCHAIKLAEALNIPKTDFEIQTLYGMADAIKKAFSSRGILVREYAPIGELIPGMGYLVRRLLENTSNEGFLRQSFHEGETASVMLAKPEFSEHDKEDIYLQKNESEFVNIQLRDFTIDENCLALKKAVLELSEELQNNPAEVSPIISGQVRPEGREELWSVSPENPEFRLANISLATTELAEEAVKKTMSFFPRWRDTAASKRCQILRRTAELMEEKREKFSAAIILEAGKPWAEADADAAEAIDFLNYYAMEAEKMFQPRKMGVKPGEKNSYFYEPRGLTLVISPWNFPLAIPCGMLSAALVCGNCAILKPAEQTSLVAKMLFDCLLEAGLPPDAAAFLPGIGEEVGDYLAKHPAVSTIVFTGSKKVGLELIGQRAEHNPQSEHVTRVIAEMGGKNSIIVDSDADLDEAVKGVLYSAFGFQGQKCSACSKAYVVGETYDRFVERLADAIRSIDLGPASDSASYLSAVIDQDAFERIQSIIEYAKKDCTVIAEGSPPSAGHAGAYYIPPIAFADIPDGHKILSEEIFGPVLAVIKAESFKQAAAAAQDSEYGLTGGVFSRSPKNILYASREFRVGNLYINRGCTGALVYRQPFGGAKMSGVGSKAGGPDYLLQFVIPRTISENTMRRGFAPL